MSIDTDSQHTKIIARSERDLKAVYRQVLRFLDMAPGSRMKHFSKHPNDALCTIPHPSGSGSLICGMIASNLLKGLAEQVIALEPALSKRVKAEHVRKSLVETFVKHVLRDGRQIDPTTTELILNEVVTTRLAGVGVTDHFLPCVLFHSGGPDEFEVGTVKFTRTSKFFRDNSQQLRRSVECEIEDHIALVEANAARGYPRDRLATKEQSRRLVRNLHARAVKTYRLYPWVAQVRIFDCDKETAEDLATRTVLAALHVIRVLLGAGATEKIRLATSRGNSLTTAALWADHEGTIHAGIGSSSIGPVGATNWYDVLSQGDRYELNLLGSAISAISNLTSTGHLHQRMIDAIHWFGDAATEFEPTSRIIKYISGIERLLFGKFEYGRRKTKFANRLTAMCRTFGFDRENRIHGQALSVYEARSALLHGALSPRDERALKQAALAESLCQFCILGAAQLYAFLIGEFGDRTSDQLDALMEEFSTDAQGFLAHYGIVMT